MTRAAQGPISSERRAPEVGSDIAETPGRTVALYITYDGLLEPLGESQVLAYVRELARDHDMLVLSFEKSADWSNTALRTRIAAATREAGIAWLALRYHKRPALMATAFDVVMGAVTGSYLVLRHRVGLIHARSYVASVVALLLKRLFRLRYVFDMRGFWPEEKVEGGTWSRKSLAYRLAKAFERRFLRSADVIVTLTDAGRRVIEVSPYASTAPVVVIPTCVDTSRFRPGNRRAADAGEFVVGCVGSVTLWYMLDEMLAAFGEILKLRSDARLVILNRGSHSYIASRLGECGIPRNRVEIREVSYPHVPEEMSRMDLGLFFIRPSFSKLGSAPTRLAEFLACGVPCLTNVGIGDVETVLNEERVGIAISDFAADTLAAGARAAIELATDSGIRARCVTVARERFSLTGGAAAYREVYRIAMATPGRADRRFEADSSIVAARGAP